MDEIAEEVELSKATLYLYFKNKSSLYFAIIIKGMKLLRDNFIKAMEKEETGLNKIISIFYAYYDYLQTYSEYYRLNLSARSPRFSKLLEEKDDTGPYIEDSVEYIELTKELLEIIIYSVNLGTKDGSLRKDLNSIETVMFLSATIEATVRLSPEIQLLLEMNNIEIKDYLKHSIDLLLNGIKES